MSGKPELAVARAGDGGADAVDDLVRFALGNLDELVLQVAAFGRDHRWAEFPAKVPGKCFVELTAVFCVGTPEYARGLLPTTQVVYDGIVRNLIWHLHLSWETRQYRQRQAASVPRR